MIIINKKLLIIPAVMVTIAGLTLFSPSAEAQESQNMSTLVQKIAQRFGLKEADVQTVFDSHRDEIRQTHEARYNEYLDQAVKDGNLTDYQKQLILKKRTELMAKWQARKDSIADWSNLTEAERAEHKAAREQEMNELKTWADQNDIDLKYLMGDKGMGRGVGAGLGKHMSRGPMW